MLKRVSIQNFKSLKDVTLDLQKVNLLIGPNNSGKTNFLKALENFASVGDNGRVSDFESVSFNGLGEDIVFQFLFSPSPNGYMVLNGPDIAENNFFFEKRAFLKAEENSFLMSTVSTKIDDYFVNNNGIKDESKEVLGGHRRELYEYIKTKVHRPDPSKLEHSSKLTGNEINLDASGSNLIAFYFYVYNNYEANANSIQSALSLCIPEITSFRTPPLQGENTLGLKFFTKQEKAFWASEVSEGVLYFLILLCIINQPNPPKLLLLEEPEKGIHPRRIREVMDFIFRLAEEKDVQIILTTHNEHVLDEFATRPEAVFVFDKDEEGATYVRNLQRDIIEPTNERNRELDLDPVDLTSNLSENWLYGLLGGVPTIP
jgi:predicted ATPase